MRVEFSHQSRSDINKIYRYGLQQFGRDHAVSRIKKIESAIRDLPLNPQAFERINKRPEIRRCPVRPHLILYAVDTDHLTILRVIDGRQDVARMIEGLSKHF